MTRPWSAVRGPSQATTDYGRPTTDNGCNVRFHLRPSTHSRAAVYGAQSYHLDPLAWYWRSRCAAVCGRHAVARLVAGSTICADMGAVWRTAGASDAGLRRYEPAVWAAGVGRRWPGAAGAGAGAP